MDFYFSSLGEALSSLSHVEIVMGHQGELIIYFPMNVHGVGEARDV